MTAVWGAIVLVILTLVAFAAWRRYLWAAEDTGPLGGETHEHVLTDRFGPASLANASHQKGVLWLSDVFSRTAARYPDHLALQVPHTGESLTYAELDARTDTIAAALEAFVDGPDQVVAVAMSQDNADIVAAHLGILRAGGVLMFLDTTMPDSLIEHMLDDARPVVILTRGGAAFGDYPTLDITALAPGARPVGQRPWLDDPAQRLATIFYTSGTTGKPKGVECPHAGYINLALTYADYFDFIPGMDSTSLTSSLGYDGSISEMYSAWVCGCAVTLLTKEQIRSGPDLVPILVEAEVTALFCPPVLLTTLTTNPEQDLPYPVCRYIIPAGEAFPPALVEPWTRARRQIINTYGPTEASTDTSRQSLRPGEAITIGSPFPNVSYVILDPDGDDSLPFGETGELCIGGVHVARGYRNLPEETAKKFVTHPVHGRLYRSGDRCRIDPVSRRVHYLGRIDAQLKVRGHRVETQAVEDILQNQFAEIEAAVLDYQNEALVAFVAAPSVMQPGDRDVALAPDEWASGVLARLAGQLPEPAVPTSIYLVRNFVMKAVSGKIDRKALPDISSFAGSDGEKAGRTPRAAAAAATASRDEVRDDPELAEILGLCQDLFKTEIGVDDRFADAGGHSILIARLAQRLQSKGWQVSVRSLMSDSDTVRKIVTHHRAEFGGARPKVEKLAQAPVRHVRDEQDATVLPIAWFTTLQMLFALVLYAPALGTFLALFGYVEFASLFTTASLTAFIVVGMLLYVIGLAAPFAALAWVMTIKLFLGGHAYRNNLSPGAYPKWSRMHLRVWCIERMETTVLLTLGAMYRSAPLTAFVLRQLGADVGRNLQCAQDAELAGPLDLLSIGDDVAIQTGAYVRTTRWADQTLHVGPVRLEDRCKIGMRAAVANDVTVGKGSWITPFTPVFASVGENEMWQGAPARCVGGYTDLKRTAAACRYSLPINLLETLNVAMQIGIYFLVSIVPTAVILWIARGFIPVGEAALSGASFTSFVAGGDNQLPPNYFIITPLYQIVFHLSLYAFLTTWASTVATSVLSSLFIRLTPASPGLLPTRGLRAALLIYRMKMLNGVQGVWTWTITGQYMRYLAGMRLPRTGASECDVMFNLVPEMAYSASKVFWSNGCYTNTLDYGAEHVKLRRIEMPENFFTGNNCVAEYGQFPSDFLLGVSTPASEIDFRRQLRTLPDEPVSIAGHPPIRFAHPPTEGIPDADEMPRFPLFLARVLLNDIFSIGTLRIVEGLTFTALFLVLQRYGFEALSGAFISLLVTEACLVALSAAVKLALVGRRWGLDHATPFWSMRHFTYFFAQDCFFAWCRGPLGLTAGTVLANPVLRLMGCTIGKRTIVSKPLQCFDWHAVRFGDDCVVNGFLQFHSFENMYLRVKRCTVGDRCTVPYGATLMGGADIADDTTLKPLSLVLKEMVLSPGSYEGSPAEMIRPATMRAGEHQAKPGTEPVAGGALAKARQPVVAARSVP
ncbi:hypothetical protein CSC94_22890 [Zhengella mangrovi]|uniref:Carrier domain-containing protein n=1 Tax=Zhengella mangrovi TaxID=1982044 RepID=A0A2G1QGZ6_9HYPH|nr:non-ribosomal peptide synthetase [Zhengella mangrovi]PHP64724.1 hypothetical protein CSC94_22890 [Zhengella mangrovi]